MGQVSRTTNELIVNSLYLLGELGVGETADAFMLSTGLDLINELLDQFSSDSIYIPYLTTLDFVFETGKATYSISDIVGADINADRIVDLSFANFSAQSVLYPLKIINKATYWNIIRLDNFQTRPAYIFLDKQATESFVTIYPAPDQPYPAKIQVKSMINSLGEHDTLGELPPFYYGFMKYSLAREFRGYYPSGNWPDTNEERYQDYYQLLKNVNETDLTIRPSGILQTNYPYYWQNILVY